jgi:hypothetical protein
VQRQLHHCAEVGDVLSFHRDAFGRDCPLTSVVAVPPPIGTLTTSSSFGPASAEDEVVK